MEVETAALANYTCSVCGLLTYTFIYSSCSNNNT